MELFNFKNKIINIVRQISYQWASGILYDHGLPQSSIQFNTYKQTSPTIVNDGHQAYHTTMVCPNIYTIQYIVVQQFLMSIRPTI